MENRQEQKRVRKPLKDLTLLDRFLFDAAMSDPEISQNILSIIFSDKEIPAIRLKPGDLDFGKMNDVYVIFIAPFDLFGEDKYMYTFRMTCDEVPGMAMNDGVVRIFLNTHGKNDDEVSQGLVEFLHYVENPERYGKNIEDSRVRKLADQIDMLKSSQEVGVKYMRLWEELAEARLEGREIGTTEAIITSIKNLMETMDLPVSTAMDALKIPEEERENY